MAGELDPRAAGARRFDGQVAVITGGGQGIGSATARRLAQEGASIVIGDMVAETSDRVCAAIREFGGECVISLGDLSRWENAEALMRRAMETYGRIDVLANIAGGTIWFQSFQYYTPEQIQAEMDRSFWTAMWCCRATLPHMIQQGSGSIVNIATHAVTGRFRVPYAAAKAGQIGMTTSLAREVAHLGIRVNCIAPSGTAADDPQQYRASTRSSEIPMGRRGEADEQAAAIAFLASHDASYITGQVLAVGGGQPYPF
ncbi:1,6-dihydroxycyclohexa-2,4-diene-1-carboxylate dehydrogenase [Geodia barretti]|uniref:1,6-dihydroxycyclohexa-2,4-diene-1-carboxylate dehydrogenase n=1 Tax=Geodia barretti TaxID=519541 RepID=A0AA35TLE0_GEOBA|nr:1,6-dihydroxycyclohexa-2,4-diene-1-carboxylate dehydrogenase [Geodia barretti]